MERGRGPPVRGRAHAGGGVVGRGRVRARRRPAHAGAWPRRRRRGWTGRVKRGGGHPGGGAGPVRAVAPGRVGCGDAGHELRGRRRREPGWRRAERGPAGPLAAPSPGLRLFSLRLVGCRVARCLLRSHLGSHAAPCSPSRPAAQRAVLSVRSPRGCAACPGARRRLGRLPPGSPWRAETPARAAAQPPPPPLQRPQPPPPPEPPDAGEDAGGRGGPRTWVTFLFTQDGPPAFESPALSPRMRRFRIGVWLPLHD